MTLLHTFVPPAFEGQGIASKMTRAVLDHIILEKIPVIVYCPYIHSHLKRNPELKELLNS
jgi:uncharacterized protein